jgi:hypothetical protein
MLFTLATVLFAGPLANAENLTCTAYDSTTGKFINGTCNAGEFVGYNSETGSYVTGTCSKSGVIAYDSATGAYIYGSCY